MLWNLGAEMGLLDMLQNGGDPGSGLLSFLNSLQQGAPPSQMGPQPSDMAQYGAGPAQAPVFAPQPTPQPSSMDNAQWPAGPVGAPSQAMAQAPQASAPQNNTPAAAPAAPQQASGGGFGNNIANALQSIGAPNSLFHNMVTNPLTALITGQSGPQAQQAQVQNLTLQALKMKGVDPAITQAALAQAAAGDPTTLHELFKTALGGDKTDAIKNYQFGQSHPGFTDDKTPTSVMEYKFYTDSLPNGQQPMPYQQWLSTKDGGGLSLNPVYGKDATGNTVLLQTGKNGVAVQSKLPDGVSLNGVDNETLASDAKRLNEGDDTVLKKYSNKGQGRIDLLRLNNEANRQRQEAGQDPIDITQNRVSLQGDIARERAAGNMEGRMAPAAVEAQGAFKIAREASQNLARTNFVPYNKVLQAGESAFSNPELKAAATAYNTAVMTYSKAITPTGVGTVTAQEHARQILETADGPAATKAAFDQLGREVDMAHQSPALARQYFADARKAKMEGRPPPPMPQYSDSGKARFNDGDIAHNPQTGETLVRQNGKWVPGT